MRFFILLLLSVPTLQIFHEEFDDSVWHSIVWAGDYNSQEPDNTQYVDITSSRKEHFRCFLPVASERHFNLMGKYDGPTAFELLSPLFAKTTCIFQIDTYWRYELCHGKSLRQFQRDEEYILGEMSEVQYQQLLHFSDRDDQVRMKKIENLNLAYYEVLLDNGSFCAAEPHKTRSARVLYVCNEVAKNRSLIHSVTEVVLCEYEVVVLTSFLCSHPGYNKVGFGEKEITCVRRGRGSRKPQALIKLERESDVFRNPANQIAPPKLKTKLPTAAPNLVDPSPLMSFLKGEVCMTGAAGFWKFDFCHRKYVEQYHVDILGTRSSVNLGRFDLATHLQWLDHNPSKRPQPVERRREIWQFYSGGQVCQINGKPRQTEVRMKCLDKSSNNNSVTLYLLEPRICRYVLVVESALLCSVLSKADGNGIIEI